MVTNGIKKIITMSMEMIETIQKATKAESVLCECFNASLSTGTRYDIARTRASICRRHIQKYTV